MSASDHLDLDALADALAGQPAGPHLPGCADCTARLAELRAAESDVVAALRALPAPALPDGLTGRLLAAVAAQPTAPDVLPASNVTPLRRAVPRRLLPAAAAAVLAVGGVGLGLSLTGGTGSSSDESSFAAGDTGGGAAAGQVTVGAVQVDSGTDWADADAAAAVLPAVLDGTAGGGAAGTGVADSAETGAMTTEAGPADAADVAADPLARLRTPEGLADCLAALAPPEDPDQQPLALDYALFEGSPALAVVLPDADPGVVAVFVVGPDCRRGADGTLVFRRLARP